MKLNINFENCYGIKALNYEFDFSKKNVFAIYASNGTMKTSFAKVFMDLSKGKDSKDEIYTQRQTKRSITKNDGEDVSKENVFVIQPYNQEYQSDDIASLLVNEELKKQYDNEYAEIGKEKNNFLGKITQLSGLKENEIENEVSNVFHHGEVNKFFESLQRIEHEIGKNDTTFSKIKYNAIFNVRTQAILEDENIIQDIETYVTKYNELLENSHFFKKGIFNHTQAEDVATQLDKNGFFQAEHSVVLRDNKEPITNKKKLEEVINKEKEGILENEDLKKVFNNLDKSLKKNQDLKNFRSYLSNNQTIVAELKNPESFKSKLWISYFTENKDDFYKLLEKYDKAKQTIEEIKQQAEEEQGTWHNVIKDFNDRFFVPFRLEVENKIDVMLGDGIAPSISFKFEDQKVEKETLLKVLSQGEKRALYILNILFEIEVRKKQNNQCFFIIDDIADSFDYKNKYAIIGYLNDIIEIPQFYLIVLSHNFDFYRSICSRLDMERKNKLNVIKEKDSIKLIEEKYQNNPLLHWKKHLDEEKILLATIPMVRNLIEYSRGSDSENYKVLTNFLHRKKKTKELTICDLKKQYETIFDSTYTNKIKDLEKNFYELLIGTCDGIVKSDEWNLEDKIIVSIAIRLKAEEFMITQIDDILFVNRIKKYQTYELFKKFKEEFPNHEKISTLEKVNLMTPENIHLNSFMYEPILDMGIDELKQLYEEVKKL